MMIGTTVVTLPWAFQQAGLILGIIITFVSCIVSFYTCHLMVQSTGMDIDFNLTLKKYFGK